MESVMRVKHVGSAYRITRTATGLWIEVLDPTAEPLSLDRWDIAELGLVFEEDAEISESQLAEHDPRLIEVLSELGIQEMGSAARSRSNDRFAEDSSDDRSDAESPGWLVNDTCLVDN